jgi:hypothetical protein
MPVRVAGLRQRLPFVVCQPPLVAGSRRSSIRVAHEAARVEIASDLKSTSYLGGTYGSWWIASA